MSGGLFSQAPIQQTSPTIPTQPGGSAMGAAMMQPNPLALQTPPSDVPLSSMMQMAQGLPGNQPPAMSGYGSPQMPFTPGPGMPGSGFPGVVGQDANWSPGMYGNGGTPTPMMGPTMGNNSAAMLQQPQMGPVMGNNSAPTLQQPQQAPPLQQPQAPQQSPVMGPVMGANSAAYLSGAG